MTRTVPGSTLIGVTGGIGSGKSTVCRKLATFLRLPCVDIDSLCRELLEPGHSGWEALRSSLEDSFFNEEGALERRKLRDAIFRDDDLRCRVDSLLHPLALSAMFAKVARLEEGPVLIDVPLLYEAGWEKYFRVSLVVYADQDVRCRRILQRDSVSPDEVMRSFRAQMPLREKALLADHVIDNSGPCWASILQVMRLADMLRETVGVRTGFS